MAGGAAYFYLRDVQNRAYHNAALTTVYVVQGNIPRGTPAATAVSESLLKQAKIPEQVKPSDAVTDLATIQGEVAVTNLVPGEALSASMFVSPAAAVSSAAQAIPKGDVAITVSVASSVQEVAGLVAPGDLVDIMVLYHRKLERFLYQNARVLAVGTNVAAPTTAAPQVASSTATTAPPVATSTLVTFAVSPVAAERLAFIQSGGGGQVSQLYLALVAPTNKPRPQPPIGAANVIPIYLTP